MTESGGGGGERGFEVELAAAAAAAATRARARASMAATISASSSMGGLASGAVALVGSRASSSSDSTLIGCGERVLVVAWETLAWLPEAVRRGMGLGYMLSVYITGGGVRLASRVRGFEERDLALLSLLIGGGEDSESESVMAEPLYL